MNRSLYNKDCVVVGVNLSALNNQIIIDAYDYLQLTSDNSYIKSNSASGTSFNDADGSYISFGNNQDITSISNNGFFMQAADLSYMRMGNNSDLQLESNNGMYLSSAANTFVISAGGTSTGLEMYSTGYTHSQSTTGTNLVDTDGSWLKFGNSSSMELKANNGLYFLRNVPTYADNTTAKAANGNLPDQIYKTSTGQLMITY